MYVVGYFSIDPQDGLGGGFGYFNSNLNSFFNPTEKKRSLGTYIILSLIDVARQRDLPYVYLGYWVSGSQKMAYKDKFKPVEFYDEGRWRAK